MAEIALSKMLQQQFEAHQVDDISSAIRVGKIKKQIKIIQLNHGLKSMSLNETADSNDANVDAMEEMIADILVQYVDAIIAAELKSDSQDIVNRMMDLLGAFSATHMEIVDAVSARALEFSVALLERVRTQACQILGYLAKHLRGNKESWKEETLEDIQASLIERITDKSQAVRLSAIQASGHCYAAASTTATIAKSKVVVQEDGDKKYDDDKMVEILLWSVWHDPSVPNRVAALEALPVSSFTMDDIIARVCDVKEKVRVQALNILRTKANTNLLAKDQLAEVIRLGLSTRCQATKDATGKLICEKWMKDYKFNPILLLQNMNVVGNEEECEKLVKAIMDASQAPDSAMLCNLSNPEINACCASVEKALVPIEQGADNLDDPASAFFHRAVLSHVTATDSTYSQSEKDSMIGKVVADIPGLCEVFEQHKALLTMAIREEDQEREDILTFVCLQLLQIVKISGLLEEGSRRHFSSAMVSMLSSIETPDDLIEGGVQALRVSYYDEDDFIACIADIITALHETALVVTEDSGTTLQTSATLRILSILTIVLESASPQIATTSFMEVAMKQVVPAVTNSNPLLREIGVSCFGKLGLFTTEPTLLCEFKPILLQVAHNEDEKLEIRGQALLGLSDWCMLFIDVMKPCIVDGNQISFVDVLVSLMSHSSKSIVAIAAEITAKLLFAGRTCDSTLLGRLVAVFFDPIMSQDDDDTVDIKEVGSAVRLQQLFSLFFPAFCLKSTTCSDAFLGCIGEALTISQQRPKGKGRSKAAAVSLSRIVEYVWLILEQSAQTDKDGATSKAPTTSSVQMDADASCRESSIPLKVMLQVAQFLASQASNLTLTNLRALSKIVGDQELDYTREEIPHLIQLKEYMEDISIAVDDATALRNLKALQEELEEVNCDEEGYEEQDDKGAEQPHEDCDSLESPPDDDPDTETEDEDEEALSQTLHGLVISKDNKENATSVGMDNKAKAKKGKSRGIAAKSILETLGQA